MGKTSVKTNTVCVNEFIECIDCDERLFLGSVYKGSKEMKFVIQD